MKMNKIVASVSAAALAVSALATNAFAAGPYVHNVSGRDVVEHYEIALEGTYESDVPTKTNDDSGLLNSPVKVKVEQTVTEAIYDLTMNGSISVSQPVKLSPATTAPAGTTEVSTSIDGSTEIKDVAVAGSAGMAKEFEVKVNDPFIAGFDATKYVVNATNSKAKVTVTLSTQLWSNNEKNTAYLLEQVIGTKNFTDYFNPNTGLAQNDDGLQRRVSRGLLTVASGNSAIKAYVSAANGVLGLNATVPTWTVKSLKVVPKTIPYALKDGPSDDPNSYHPYTLEFKGNFNFDALKDMSNGGTVTLKFSKAVEAGKQYSINIQFQNAGLYLGSAHTYTVTNDTATFEMPADFSGTLNGIYGLPQMTISSSDWTMPNNCSLVSVTLTPKAQDVAEATTTTAPKANEGDDITNKPADTEAPATTTTTAAPATQAPAADDKNQPTGVAIAIVPAIVAAAGVIVAKKRK